MRNTVTGSGDNEGMTSQPAPRMRGHRWRAATAAALVAVAAAAAGCTTGPTTHEGAVNRAAQAPVPVGGCVTLRGDGNEEALNAVAAGCGDGVTYTVAAHTDAVGKCPSPADATVFVEPFADRPTARLCLVPDFVVGRCYAFALPTGNYALAGCADAEVATIRIDERFEVSDADACTDPRPSRAMVYRSVPRTYCLSYPGIER